ncbi:MAG: geranylgeranylglycerol-phosphate geranylgeranyltransferase [Chitinophagaceae bacterium]|nr:geranylgeranylglycerol-phosphate geranylgeranyltransferase [Chitinophagaceae bacterium]
MKEQRAVEVLSGGLNNFTSIKTPFFGYIRFMKGVSDFLRVIRWQNLVFIAITQLLFHFFVVVPSATGSVYNFPLRLTTPLLLLLCFSSICIAAAGYIINDYFDINIDEVNKPDKMVVGKTMSRRYALLWHLILSGVGLAIGIFVSIKLGNWLIAIGNFACVGLLWHYSTSFKRQLLIGNVVISALTAWVILVLLVAELPGWWTGELVNEAEKETVARLSRIGVLYAAFAFIISLIREVIKDLEDIEGDRKDGCTTMPIVWGIQASKVFIGVWLVVLISTLFITQVYVIQFGWWYSAGYIILLVVFPLIMVFKSLIKASSTNHFTALSRKVKWVMLLGILSMVFFMIYTR